MDTEDIDINILNRSQRYIQPGSGNNIALNFISMFLRGIAFMNINAEALFIIQYNISHIHVIDSMPSFRCMVFIVSSI